MGSKLPTSTFQWQLLWQEMYQGTHFPVLNQHQNILFENILKIWLMKIIAYGGPSDIES